MTALAKQLKVGGSDGSISAYGQARSTIAESPLSPDELRRIDAYWRASLYLCLGMLYLKENVVDSHWAAPPFFGAPHRMTPWSAANLIAVRGGAARLH
jgi:hypothetical protein